MMGQGKVHQYVMSVSRARLKLLKAAEGVIGKNAEGRG
jgi:hypothetical protein